MGNQRGDRTHTKREAVGAVTRPGISKPLFKIRVFPRPPVDLKKRFRFGGNRNAHFYEEVDLLKIAYAGASFADSDSADLAEIAYGNRMEIASAGASFANCDSADFAKNLVKKCAKTKW